MTAGAGKETGKEYHAQNPGGLTFFGSSEQIRIGAVVVDRYSEVPGTVQSIDGRYINVIRPAGRVWCLHYRRVRPATDYEKRQLVALSRLRRQQRRDPA